MAAPCSTVLCCSRTTSHDMEPSNTAPPSSQVSWVVQVRTRMQSQRRELTCFCGDSAHVSLPEYTEPYGPGPSQAPHSGPSPDSTPRAPRSHPVSASHSPPRPSYAPDSHPHPQHGWAACACAHHEWTSPSWAHRELTSNPRVSASGARPVPKRPHAGPGGARRPQRGRAHSLLDGDDGQRRILDPCRRL